jgi:hypothetical protein
VLRAILAFKAQALMINQPGEAFRDDAPQQGRNWIALTKAAAQGNPS